MPHIIVEYSDDIASKRSIDGLCLRLFEGAVDTQLFGEGQTIKVRAHACQNVFMGNGDQSFVHAELRMLPGRTAEQKQSATQTLLNVLVAELPEVTNLSVDCADLSDAYAKQ